MLTTVWAREYWNVGVLKTCVWRNEICFYIDGTEQNIKSDHHLLLISNIPFFSDPPALRIGSWGELKAWPSGSGYFTLDIKKRKLL